MSEILEDDESLMTYLRKKRLKKTELSDMATDNSKTNKEEAASSSTGQRNRARSDCLDQPVELESVSPSFFGNVSEKMVITEDGISSEVVENTLPDGALDCCSDFERNTSNGDKLLQIHTSNGNTNENKHDSDMLITTLLEEKPHSETNNIAVSAQTDSNINKDSRVLDMPDIIGEHRCDAMETVSNVEVSNLGKEKADKCPRVSSGDALGNVGHAGGFKDETSQIVGTSVNVPIERAFAVYPGKKLLVLDVNGLLVDINSYVPYDYDPDEILLKKAVFRRPFCEDFLKFCFERFNVGVWSSKTKRNMEPIIDFLFKNDKKKLLFHWDQSHCTYTGYNTVEKSYKPLLLKKLKKLWDKYEPDLPWEMGVYNESNTLLLDDSPYKALCNPMYTAIFPFSYGFRNLKDNSLGPGGDLRVYLEGLSVAENVQEYIKEHPFGQRPITEKNLSWGFYLRVIKAAASPPR